MTREQYSPTTADQLEKSGWTFAQVPIALFRDHDVSDGAKVLFSYLAWRQGQHTSAWPAIGTIASDLDIHEATVRRRTTAGSARRAGAMRTPTTNAAPGWSLRLGGCDGTCAGANGELVQHLA